MTVSFARITKGCEYSRKALAVLWGYKSYHAIARGVVSRQSDNKIILFVTEEKQESLRQYRDHLDGKVLKWEGPDDHFGESRMLNASNSGDEIHLFYRVRHHSDFTYMGRVSVIGHNSHAQKPSQFTLKIDP